MASTEPHSARLIIPDGSSVSNSVVERFNSLVAIRVPAFTTGTAYLLFETTEDNHPDNDPVTGVSDGSATWDPVFDYNGNPVRVSVSATEARRIQVDTTKFQRFGRFRVKAVQSDGATAQNQTGAKTIVPKFKKV